MSYEPQQTLTDPARDRSELWRTGAGLAAITVLSFVLAMLWFIAGSMLPGGGALHPDLGPAGMVWTLSTFIGPTLALIIVMRVLHKRGILSLIGPLGPARAQFLRVLGVQAAVIALAMLLPTPGGAEVQLNQSVLRWLSWVPLALVMLVIQIGIEELIFRGYLQSQLAARFRHPIVWIGLPSILFALLHLDPTLDNNRWAVVAVTFAFAIAAADLTARTGTLGPALAMHLVNNFTSLFLIGTSGQMSGLALYIIPLDMSDPALWPVFLIEIGLIFIAWLGARIVLRR
ncbi:CPBP family intramembrane glutamic endopeptidase [Pseudooceanicola sp. MF1-13]|uniref:CPBP family intramembrane glutamic endopeptidase n=1 Tax=Pseudooceanicola sp. MF1-13 TaxID=3379095 RepID=UPI003892BF72